MIFMIIQQLHPVQNQMRMPLQAAETLLSSGELECIGLELTWQLKRALSL